jgi:fatty-acyl-CoA synthase
LTIEMQVTGTFKHRKVELVNEGFDVTTLSDPIYVRDDAAKTYKLLTPPSYKDILDGTVRF